MLVGWRGAASSEPAWRLCASPDPAAPLTPVLSRSWALLRTWGAAST